MAEDIPARGAIAAAGRGEAWAVEQIWTTIRDFARHVCRRSPGPELNWEDLAQEAGRRVFTNALAQYRGTGSERSFLYTIVKTTWLDLARSSVRRRRREEAQVSWGDRNSERDDAEPAMRVGRILARLDEPCRHLLERVFLDGLSYSDLAAATGLAESSLRAKVSRCIRRARESAT